MQRRDVLNGMGALAAGSLGMGAQAAPAVRWKMATGYRQDIFHTQNATQFVEETGRAVRGELHIAMHPDNSFVKLPDIFAAVEGGTLEMGEVLMSGIVQSLPLAGADSVPFVATTYKDAGRLWQYQKPLITKALAEKGLAPLYAVPWPPQGLFSVRPVRSRKDCQGLKMRAYNPTTARIAELLGATPVEVPAGDIPKALAAGRIEALITSSVTGVDSQVWNQAKFYYDLNAWIPKNLVIANQKALNALSPAHLKALQDAARAAEDRGWVMSEAVHRTAVDELRTRGIAVDRITPEMGREIQRIGERLSREWVRGVGHQASHLFIPFFTQANS